jgi:hypothetical protein
MSIINGAHNIIYSKDEAADIAFFRDVLQLKNVDAGHGWFIFALPPSELAFHPSPENNKHELFLTCDDIEAFILEMAKHKILCSPVQNQRWGSVTYLTLPGGGSLGIYQPSHARPF